MKNDKEIKEWIDSKEVLTQTQLKKFIRTVSSRFGDRGNSWETWWRYALSTKDWNKMKEHRTLKMKTRLAHKDKKIIERVIKKFGHLSSSGDIRTSLKKEYNITVTGQTVRLYMERLGVEHKKHKEHISHAGKHLEWRGTKEKVMSVFKKDKRLLGIGCVRGQRLLQNIYNINLNPTAVYRYKKEFLNNRSQNV